jgi:hypothetical protein
MQAEDEGNLRLADTKTHDPGERFHAVSNIFKLFSATKLQLFRNKPAARDVWSTEAIASLCNYQAT